MALGACSSDDDSQTATRDSGAQPRDAGSRQDAEKSDSGASSKADAGSKLDAASDAEPQNVSAASDDDAGQVGETSTHKCDVEAPTACVAPKPSYMTDVAPILKVRCSICHNGQAGSPWPFSSYGHVADWQNEIRDQVSHCTMPPVDANVPITIAERETILMWIRCGLPQ